MKKYLIYMGMLAAAVFMACAPNPGVDAAQLKPVELLRVRTAPGAMLVETETGDFGVGADMEGALRDLRKSTSGLIFLETIDCVIMPKEYADLPAQLLKHLRPGCSVCVCEDKLDLQAAAEYLNVHKSSVTLNDCRAMPVKLPVLQQREGRLYLAK